MNLSREDAERFFQPRPDRGASLIEYALLVALIAIVCIVAVGFLGTSASESFDRDANSLFNG